jgi:hypothetical protein
MSTKLVRLEDNTLVEIEALVDQAEQISGGMADKVNATLDKIKPILISVCKPITSAWHELNKDMHIEAAEVQLGLSFEGEGNIYITRSKAQANLTVKLILKPKDE